MDHPDVNMDRVNREFCGVINVWSESGLSKNDDFSLVYVTNIFDDDEIELKKLF